MFRVVSQYACINVSTVLTTVHSSEPARDLWLVSREEAASLPTSDFKAFGLIIKCTRCILKDLNGNARWFSSYQTSFFQNEIFRTVHAGFHRREDTNKQ
jgi:hypothetical protein